MLDSNWVSCQVRKGGENKPACVVVGPVVSRAVGDAREQKAQSPKILWICEFTEVKMAVCGRKMTLDRK